MGDIRRVLNTGQKIWPASAYMHTYNNEVDLAQPRIGEVLVAGKNKVGRTYFYRIILKNIDDRYMSE